jgi:hypothetical protein
MIAKIISVTHIQAVTETSTLADVSIVSLLADN